MKPVVGILIELFALAFVLALGPFVPSGFPLGLYVVIGELAATYLVHCPAHYVVGSVVGIRFRSLQLGRTTLAKVLPVRFASLAKLIPVLTLSTVKSSLTGVPKKGIAMMYRAGTIASVSSALVIAAVASAEEPLIYSGVAWAIALGYLIFDLVFSPRSGDLSRADAVLRA